MGGADASDQIHDTTVTTHKQVKFDERSASVQHEQLKEQNETDAPKVDTTTSASSGSLSGLLRQLSARSAADKASDVGDATPSLDVIGRVSSTPSTDQPFELKKQTNVQENSRRSRNISVSSMNRGEYHRLLLEQLHNASLNTNDVFATFVICFGSSFLFGYNIGVLNQPTNLIKSFYNVTYTDRHGSISDATINILWSLTTALFVPGGMIGSFLGGWMADRFGRIRSTMLSQFFSITGSVLSTICVASSAPELLMLGRLLVGVNSGIGNCVAPMFLSEIAPVRFRGALSAAHQLSVTLGILVSSVLGFPQLLATESGWPFLICFELLPSLVSLSTLWCLPDSPRYLLLVMRDRDAARKAVGFYFKTKNSELIDVAVEEIDTEAQPGAVDAAAAGGDGKSKAAPYTMLMLLRTVELWKPLVIACMLQLIQQFSGINAVFFYSENIFAEAGIPRAYIPFAVIGTNAINVWATVASLYMIDKAGRRILLMIPMFIMAVVCILLTISFNLQTVYPLMSYFSIVFVIIYVIGFAVGLGPIPMMVSAELFRQGPRPKAMAIAGVANWITMFIIAMTFPPLSSAIGKYVFIIFAVMLLLFIAYTYFFVPETKDKTIEQIAAHFGTVDQIAVKHSTLEDEGDSAMNTSQSASAATSHENTVRSRDDIASSDSAIELTNYAMKSIV